jgi:hypothetical protein
MKRIILMLIILTASTGVRSFAQQNTDDESAIRTVLKIYERSVINRDSVAFYDLFNNGPVEWAAGIKDRSQEKIIAKQGPRTNYFSSSYKGFCRAICKMKSAEDKFDHIEVFSCLLCV